MTATETRLIALSHRLQVAAIAASRNGDRVKAEKALKVRAHVGRRLSAISIALNATGSSPTWKQARGGHRGHWRR